MIYLYLATILQQPAGILLSRATGELKVECMHVAGQDKVMY